MKKRVGWVMACACLLLSTGAWAEAGLPDGLRVEEGRLLGQVQKQVEWSTGPVFFDAALPPEDAPALPVLRVEYRQFAKEEAQAAVEAIGQAYNHKAVEIFKSKDSFWFCYNNPVGTYAKEEYDPRNPLPLPGFERESEQAAALALDLMEALGIPRERCFLTLSRPAERGEQPLGMEEKRWAEGTERHAEYMQELEAMWGLPPDTVTEVSVVFGLNGCPIDTNISWDSGYAYDPGSSIGSYVGAGVAVSDDGKLLGFTITNYPEVVAEEAYQLPDWRETLSALLQDEQVEKGQYLSASNLSEGDGPPYLFKNIVTGIEVRYRSDEYKTFAPYWNFAQVQQAVEE